MAWTSVKALSEGEQARSFQVHDIHVAEAEKAWLVQYTSGSITDPKGVVLSYANIAANLDVINAQVPTSEEEPVTTVTWLPPYHDLGLFTHIMASMLVAGHLVVMRPIDFIRRPSNWLRYISEYRAGHSSAPDFAYRLCTRRIAPDQIASLDLSGWTTAINAAEPIRPETMDAFHELCKPAGLDAFALRSAYGLAEATVLVSVSPPGSGQARARVSKQAFNHDRIRAPESEADTLTLISSGRPIQDTSVTIRDPESDAILPGDRVGEICVEGPAVAQTYLESSIEKPLRTGDLGFLQDEELYVTGRISDLIFFNGQNYYPQDIEAAAIETGMVDRACALADDAENLILLCEKSRRTAADTPERACGEMCRAVKARTGLDISTVSLIRANSLPLTSSGKLRRGEARELYRSGGFEALFSFNPFNRDALTDIESFLPFVLRFAGMEGLEIEPNTPLSDLGFDSLSLLQMGLHLEKEYGLYFRIEDIPLTVLDLYGQIAPLTLRPPSSEPPAPSVAPDTESRRKSLKTWRSIAKAYRDFMKISDLAADNPNQIVHLCQAMESYFDVAPSGLRDKAVAFQTRQLYTNWFWYLPGLQRTLRDWDANLPAEKRDLERKLHALPPRSLLVLGHMHGWEWLLENILLAAHAHDLNLCLIGDVQEVEKLVMKGVGFRNQELIGFFRSAMVDVNDPQFAFRLTEAINAGKRLVSLPDTVLAAHRLYHSEDIPFLKSEIRLAAGVFKLAEAMESPVFQLDYHFDDAGLQATIDRLEGGGYRKKMESFAATIAGKAEHWAQWQILPKPEFPPDIPYHKRGSGFLDSNGIVAVRFGDMVLLHSLPNRRSVQVSAGQAKPLWSGDGPDDGLQAVLEPLFISRE